jgi:hypothetical protein
VSHPQRAEDLIGDMRIDWRVAIRLFNHPETVIGIKDIRSSCIGACAPWPLIRPCCTQNAKLHWFSFYSVLHCLQEVGRQAPTVNVTRHSSICNACAGKLVTIMGTVVRSSGTRPLVTAMGFACGSCGEEHLQRFDDGVYMW